MSLDVAGDVTIHQGLQWPTLVVDTSTGTASEITTAILSRSREHKVLWFDLGDIDFGSRSQPIESLLERLSRLREESLLGISLRCRLRSGISRDEAVLLRNGGVRSVALRPGRVVTEQGQSNPLGMIRLNLDQLHAVGLLHSYGIDVRWDWLCRPGADGREIAQTTRLFEAARHLPPPAELVVAPQRLGPEGESCAAVPQAMKEALSQWKQKHVPWSVTYARGPGFVRIRDRRTDRYDWTFVTLKALQAQVFLFCEQARSFDEIAAQAVDTHPEAVRRFLDVLVAQQMMCCVLDDYYQQFAVRRKAEEMWVSDVF